VKSPPPPAPGPIEVVWTLAYVLRSRPDGLVDLLNGVETGYEPHEILARTPDRLIVRSLTTRRHRVLRPSDLV
jgi:hypothetical protein